MMKPVMASLKERLGDRVTYHYHEFNQPDAARVNRDFAIQSHPVLVLLDRKGRLVGTFRGVVRLEELESALERLL
jgi:hypothetical protein